MISVIVEEILTVSYLVRVEIAWGSNYMGITHQASHAS